MSDISSMLGAEAAPHTIEHDGKTYNFGPIDQRAKSAWERHLWHEARQALRESVEGLPDSVQAEAASKLAARKAAHEFAFFGPVSAEAMKTLPGQVVMGGILANVPRAEAEALFMARPGEVSGILTDIVNESFSSLVEFGKAQAAGGPEGNGVTAQEAIRQTSGQIV